MIYAFTGTYSSDDKVKFKKAQESDLKQICKYLGVDYGSTKDFKYKVFDTREGKQGADPNHSISRASTRTEDMTVYRFWLPDEDPHFPHEITHLVAHIWETKIRPYVWEVELDTWDDKKITRKMEMFSTSFMQEGLATAVDDIVFGRKLMEEGEWKSIDDWCRESVDKIPTISECINFDDFCNFDNKIVVPFTASLSKYLLNNFGLEKFKKMYVGVKEILSPEENVRVIEKVYGMNEKELMESWKKSIFQ